MYVTGADMYCGAAMWRQGGPREGPREGGRGQGMGPWLPWEGARGYLQTWGSTGRGHEFLGSSLDIKTGSEPVETVVIEETS